MTLISATLERGSVEWQKARIREINADFFVYAQKNLHIRNKDGEIVPLVPNSIQRKVVDAVLTDLAAGMPVRYIILKARQQGLSTIIEALIYWWTATHKNISATITAHEGDSATKIYGMFQRYYQNARPQFQPSLRYNTKHDLTFAKLGSQISTASADNTATGRGGTNQLLHNSEVGFWRDGASLVAGLLQTVPLRPKTMVFHESTANGIGGYFYDTWQKAKAGESNFKPLFFAWFDAEEYRLPVPASWTPSGLTLELRDKYGLEDDQLYWYETKYREYNGDIDRMRQEYPSNDVEAFIASGRPRFDIQTLLEMDKEATNGTMGEVLKEDFAYRFNPLPKSGLEVWKLPERLGQYVIGADVAEGLAHGDYSVAQVVDRMTREVVARMRLHCDPDVFGDKLYDLGMFYNAALLGPEVNNHGLTTLQRLKDLEYPNLYQREGGHDKQLNEISASRLGWRTDSRTKPLMIDYAATAIREKSVTIYDTVTIREHMTYVLDENGRTNAQEGCFDDCVMALAIALQMFEWSFTQEETAVAYHNPQYTH